MTYACTSRVRPGAVAVALLALAAGGCSMADSKLLETDSKGCHSDLGAYFLPRDVLHVEVRHINWVTPSNQEPEAAAKRQNHRHEIAMIEIRTLPDRSRGFCHQLANSVWD